MEKSKTLILSVIILAAVCLLSVLTAVFLPVGDTAGEHTDEAADSDTVVSESDSEEDEVRLGPVAAPIEIYPNDPNRTLTAAELKKYPQRTNIPSLYINLANGKSQSRIQHSVFMDATYTLVDGDSGIFEQPMQIAGRGNYSWNMGEKRTYAISLNEKADLLGMGAAKRWVLISSYNDRTLMRNYMTMTFSRNIGMEFAPECKHIDLFFNGKYFGQHIQREVFSHYFCGKICHDRLEIINGHIIRNQLLDFVNSDLLSLGECLEDIRGNEIQQFILGKALVAEHIVNLIRIDLNGKNAVFVCDRIVIIRIGRITRSCN